MASRSGWCRACCSRHEPGGRRQSRSSRGGRRPPDRTTWSSRRMVDRNRALWGGFLIAAGGRRILFAGDSGYGPHFREIGARLGPIDLALLPIGAYEPRWFMKDIHMNPAEAVQAHLDLAARQSIAMHFGTFQLTLEGIEDPVRELAQALRERGVPAERFRTVEVGESVYIHRSAAVSPLC